MLQGLDVSRVGDAPETWEKVVRKLRGGLMPPAGAARPDQATHDGFLSSLQAALDAAAAANPNPGRTETAHRLNRVEYVNAVRDLLAVELNAPDLLPPDDSSFGFDNIAGVLKMSPSLMERYLAAAKVVSRSAVGSPPPALSAAIYRVPREMQQHDRVEALPHGTRGGTLVRHLFPLDAEYDIDVELTGQRRASAIEETLEVSIDGERVGHEMLAPGEQPARLRVPVRGGSRDVGIAFLRTPPNLVEQLREPFQNPEAPGGTGGGPLGLPPGIATVTITGPHHASGPGETPSRRRVFVCRPATLQEETPCAGTILTTLARRAYRGSLAPESVRVLLEFYQAERAEGGTFDQGIELAIRRLLMSPEFLYRIEADPGAPRSSATGSTRGPEIYRIADLGAGVAPVVLPVEQHPG